MPALMVSVFLMSLNQSLSRVQDGLGRRWQNFFLYGLWSIMLYVVAAQLAPSLGALGLAYAFFAAEAVLFVSIALYVELIVRKRILMSNIAELILSIGLIVSAYLVFTSTDGNLFYGLATILVLLSLLPIFRIYLSRSFSK